MQIKFDSNFEYDLLLILDYIASDKLDAALQFKHGLKESISLLKKNPYMCKESSYFGDEAYRDLVYKGYTIIYKITRNEIMILEIFKWINR